MAPPLRVTLDPAAHDELVHRYQTTRDATTRTPYHMILLRAEGHQVVEVARLTRCSSDTVRRVLKRYLASGPDAVPHRPHLGQPPHYPPAWEAELVRVADLDPRSVGVDSAPWTWSPIRPWLTTCSPPICPACWACSPVRTCTCKTRSRSPCTPP